MKQLQQDGSGLRSCLEKMVEGFQAGIMTASSKKANSEQETAGHVDGQLMTEIPAALRERFAWGLESGRSESAGACSCGCGGHDHTHNCSHAGKNSGHCGGCSHGR